MARRTTARRNRVRFRNATIAGHRTGDRATAARRAGPPEIGPGRTGAAIGLPRTGRPAIDPTGQSPTGDPAGARRPAGRLAIDRDRIGVLATADHRIGRQVTGRNPTGDPAAEVRVADPTGDLAIAVEGRPVRDPAGADRIRAAGPIEEVPSGARAAEAQVVRRTGIATIVVVQSGAAHGARLGPGLTDQGPAARAPEVRDRAAQGPEGRGLEDRVTGTADLEAEAQAAGRADVVLAATGQASAGRVADPAADEVPVGAVPEDTDQGVPPAVHQVAAGPAAEVHRTAARRIEGRRSLDDFSHRAVPAEVVSDDCAEKAICPISA